MTPYSGLLPNRTCPQLPAPYNDITQTYEFTTLAEQFEHNIRKYFTNKNYTTKSINNETDVNIHELDL